MQLGFQQQSKMLKIPNGLVCTPIVMLGVNLGFTTKVQWVAKHAAMAR
jgi:hypothetical protein